MKIELTQIEEPKLEFGNGRIDAYVKDALLLGDGPYGSNFYKGIRTIKLGLVAVKGSVANIKDWIDSLDSPSISEEDNWKRFREFRGTNEILKCVFELSERDIREISEQDISLFTAQPTAENFNGLLSLYSDRLESLFGDSRPDCILIHFPEEIASLRIANPRLSAEERMMLEGLKEMDETDQLELFEMGQDQKKLKEFLQELMPQAEELLYRNFYRALKARCMSMPNSVPLQVIRNRTFLPDESSQSRSTIAWNICLGMYYKAGNIPWRLTDIPNDTCFIGISFHYLKRRSGDMMYASVAQAFSSSGEGFALKGSNIPRDQTINKRPYLRAQQASELIKKVLDFYQKVNGTLPSRVVVHKTSRYQMEETEGFKEAILAQIPTFELVWLAPSGFRLLRKGMYPPNRGLICRLPDDQTYLFTTGYVSRWNEYPGPHIPSPLQIGTSSPERIEETCKEILSLTKMNWNSTEGIGRHPITLSFARRVGMTMTELGDEESPNPSYRFYM